MTQNPFQWEHPKAMEYNETIRKRIIGYEQMFQGMMDYLDGQVHEQALIVGAGGGQELVTLGTAFPQLHFTAVDPAERMLDLAKLRLAQEQLALEVDYVGGTVESLCKERLFSLASCHLVLHFLSTAQKKSLIRATAERMEPGGIAFFSSINGQVGSPLFDQMLDAWGVAMRRNGVTEKQWQAFRSAFGDTCFPLTATEMRSLFEGAGFKDIELYYKAYAVEAYVMKK